MKTMSKINQLFNNPNTVYLFDVHGVLAALEYGEYHHYHYNDDDWAKAIEHTDYYKGIRPFKTMQDFISKRDMNHIYVVTKVANDFEKSQKESFLYRHYNIASNHIYAVTKDQDKLVVINELKKKYPDLEDKYFVLIDDTVEVLNYIMDHSQYS